MKYLFTITFILTLIFIQCSDNKNEISENQIVGMRKTAVDFMKELKGILINQMQTGGVVKAVSVCSDTAQVLTNNYGIEKGVLIKRVSFKNRNENNYPDKFEQGVLKRFQLMYQNNELNNETEYAEIVSEGEYKYLWYLKPIIIQPECLNCHGSESDMMPEVKELIAQNYPGDKALDYKAGDLRGAVSVKKLIE